MLFQIGLFKNKMTLKSLKIMVISLFVIGGIVLLLSIFGPEFMKHSFVSGFGTGLLLFSGISMVIYLKKRKEEYYEDDLEASLTDERVIKQRLKVIAISNFILIFALIILVTISVFYEFSFSIGGSILLILYVTSLLILKYYYFKKG